MNLSETNTLKRSLWNESFWNESLWNESLWNVPLWTERLPALLRAWLLWMFFEIITKKPLLLVMLEKLVVFVLSCQAIILVIILQYLAICYLGYRLVSKKLLPLYICSKMGLAKTTLFRHPVIHTHFLALTSSKSPILDIKLLSVYMHNSWPLWKSTLKPLCKSFFFIYWWRTNAGLSQNVVKW